VKLDPFGGETHIVTCRQCKKAPCADACPVEAIRMDPEGLYWMVDYQTCTGCQACIGACPFDAMLYDPTADRVIKCDTCDGNPTCADICPTGALRWGNAEEERR
jgi:Fe-S-cluster-containing hydrogenase component 2